MVWQVNWAADMNKKLALLCEQQINAILNEADVAFHGIVNAATQSKKLCDELQKHASAGHSLQDQALVTEMNKLLMSMQFHDEFNQRLHHVMALCRLIAESAEENAPCDQSELSLLARLSTIFSVGSEFAVLQNVFPQYRTERSDSAIELF